jgi:DNA-binding winged helix-turn-helix (wHTH) protein
VTAPSTLQFDRYRLNPVTGQLHDAERVVTLRPKAFEVLHYLLRHAGRITTKEEIFEAVWPNVVVTDDSLVQCICEIRRALNDRDHQLPVAATCSPGA